MRQSMCNRKRGDTPWILIVSYFSTYAAKSLDKMSSDLRKNSNPDKKGLINFNGGNNRYKMTQMTGGSRNYNLFPSITNLSHQIT